MIKRILTPLILAASAFLLSACGPLIDPAQTSAPFSETTYQTTDSSSTPVVPQPSQNALFSLPFYRIDDKINPLSDSTEINRSVLSLLFDNLIDISPEGTVSPVLAESIDVSGITVTIHLRTDAAFHDGSYMHSDDVVWSLNFAKNNEFSVYKTRFSNVLSIEAIDSSTVVLTLERTEGDIIRMLSVPIIKKNTGTTSNAVGTGRYRLQKSEANNYLLSNPIWFGLTSESVFPISLIQLSEITDKTSYFYTLISGGASFLQVDPFSLTNEQFTGNSDIYSVETRKFQYISFNTAYFAPTANADLRKALSQVIDLKILLEDIIGDTNYSAGIFPTRISKIENPEIPSADLSSASELMVSAGYYYSADRKWLSENGKQLSLKIVCSRSAQKRAIADYLCTTLNDFGIKATVSYMEDPVSAVKKSNFDLAVLETLVSPDYDFSFMFKRSGSQNFNGFAVSGLDAKLDTFYIRGQDDTYLLARQINDLINDSLPILPLGYKTDIVLIDRSFKLGQVKISDSNPFFDLFSWISY